MGVVNVDLRGHGETGWADSYRAGEYAADVAALIAELDVGPVVVVGHSLGGVVATALAGSRPDLVTALFMEDPPLYHSEESVRAADEIVAGFPELATDIRRWQQGGATVEELVAEYGLSESPYPGRSMLDLLGRGRVAARVEALLACDPSAVDSAFEGELWEGFDPEPLMSQPVTVISADPALEGMFLPEHAERYRTAVPQARVIAVAGSAHSIRLHRQGWEIYRMELRALLGSL